MSQDLTLVGRDIAEASRLVVNALCDVEDIERDAADWPEGGVVAYLAGEARSALDALGEAVGIAFEATDPGRS